ncbi:MAG TPA: MBOAT family O-acyltransferase [Candidatus Baltobacteraceae bacterium]|nr:MBOAT family O-acyltransferase [Candidatus Baltobacteraceae bacterium]
MTVPSYIFLGFAAAVALAINVSSKAGWRRGVLFVANIAFFATFVRRPLEIVPFGALLAFGYAAMRLVQARKDRALFIVFVVAVAVAFCWLKRYSFVPAELFLPFPYVAVGMSYVFFRIVHLIVDAYQGTLTERLDPLTYVNYTLNFTCLVAGPIQFYGDYRRSEREDPPPLTGAAAVNGAIRMITGMFKVALASPALTALQTIAVTALAAPQDPPARAWWAALATAAFLVGLYLNFSGYTDFVIGTAVFLRIALPENFNQPFLSESFIDFWNRWHITLSTWVKTYIYSPVFLAMMRRVPAPRYQPLLGVAAYFVAFFFVGVWHGQTSEFVMLGVMLGVGVSANKLFQIEMTKRLGRARYRALCAQPLWRATSRALTFSWFAVAALFFWSTWSQLGRFGALLGPTGLAAYAVVLLAGSAVVLSAYAAFDRAIVGLRLDGTPFVLSPYYRAVCYTALAVVVFSFTVILNAPAAHVVYKAF